ncbi:unnamed protein product, partial [Hapterophycus canaliculatus]
TDRDDQSRTLSWSEDLDSEIYSKEQLETEPELLADVQEDAEARTKLENGLTLRGILSALPDAQSSIRPTLQEQTDFRGNSEVSEQRVERPLASDSDDETSGLKNEGHYSSNFARDQEYDGLDRDQPGQSNDESAFFVHHNPTTNELSFFADGSAGLPSGLLLAELVEFLQDPAVDDDPEVIQEFVDAGKPTAAATKYPIATGMRLVLSFEDPVLESEAPKAWRENPVPFLLDLTSDNPTLGGGEHKLTSVLGDVEELPQYNLVLNDDIFQSNEQIGLAWRLEREQSGAAVNSNAIDSFSATDELDRYVVTRRVFGLNEGVVTSSFMPSWLDPQDLPTTLVRPPFQFIDDQLQN